MRPGAAARFKNGAAAASARGGAFHPVALSGNGRLNRPAAVLADGQTLWIADLGNHRIVKVTLSVE